MRFRFILPLAALALFSAAPAAAQQATISGVVMDSLAGAPLRGATVQLVPSARTTAARTTVSDAMGRFTFAEVADGRYVIGFLHPTLDALGVEPIARAVTVAGEREVSVDLAIPGPARIRAAVCGPESRESGMIMGVVRSARGGPPVSGATVVAEWIELAIGGGRVAQQTARREVKTAESGAFILCDVPSPGAVRIVASQGSESTDRVETDVPRRGFLRRDLFLGEARVAARDTAPADSLRRAPPRTGPGRLSGVVTAADGGRPLAGARVSVVDGVPTRTDASGEWTLEGAPSGTRVLEVRAPGYHPVRRVVNVVDGERPVRVTLSQVAAMMDTIRAVVRSRSNRSLGGFEERRRSRGVGRFLSAEDIEKRRVIVTSELLDMIPGLRRERSDEEGDRFTMRSVFAGAERCVPSVYMNGHRMDNLSATELDMLAAPREIAAMEVYTESQSPPQFQSPMSGCGSIVLWTK